MSHYPSRGDTGGGRGGPRDGGRGGGAGGAGGGRYGSGGGSGRGGQYGGYSGGYGGGQHGAGGNSQGGGYANTGGRHGGQSRPPPPPPAQYGGTQAHGGFGQGGYGPAQQPAQAPPAPSLAKAEGDDVQDEPVLRKDHASIGVPIRLTSNCFGVELREERMKWYKYEVLITQDERANSGGTSRRKPGPLPRALLREVWTAVERAEERAEETGQAKHFKGIRAAYDGGAACYADEELPPDLRLTRASLLNPFHVTNIKIDIRPRDTFTLTVRNPLAVPVQSLRNYVTGYGTFRFGEVAEALSAINVMFRHGPCATLYSTRTSFFQIPSAQGDTLIVSPNFLQLIRKSSMLQRYAYEDRGFFAAIRPCQRGLQLTLNSTSTAFFIKGRLADFIIGFLTGPGGRSPDLASLPELAFVQVNRLLRRLDIVVDRRDSLLKTKVKGRGLVPKRARDVRFLVNGTEETDVEEYVLKQFGIRLQHPDWPVVETKKDVYYPLELISLNDKNKFNRRLTRDQQTLASKFQAMKPAEKIRYIRRIRGEFVTPLCAPLLTACGLLVDTATKQVDGRVIAPPASSTPSATRPAKCWATTRSSQGRWLDDARDRQPFGIFLDDLLQKAAALGLRCTVDVQRLAQRATYEQRADEPPKKTLHSAVFQAEQVFGKKPKLLIWVFAEAKSADYPVFKFESVKLGIASQAIQSKKIRKLDVQLAVNLSMKINGKLGGQKFRLDANSTAGVSGKHAGWLSQRKPMVVGADLSHEPDRPSVAVLTATMHDQAVICAEAASVQPLIEPGEDTPPRSRAKKQEVIRDAHKLFLTLLKARVKAGRGRLPPDSILILRDGVSEGEFRAVIYHEFSEYRRAIKSFRTEADLSMLTEIGTAVIEAETAAKVRDASKSGLDVVAIKHAGQQALSDVQKVQAEGKKALDAYNPKLSFIACIKGHHLRFFEERGPSTNNIPPGTAVDSGVTDARWAESYMAVHKALIGTTRPTRYVLLVDDNKMTSNDFEATINALCFSYQRCNKAVSLPAPVYYAHLVAGQIRQWIISDHGSASSAGGTDSESTPASRLQDYHGAQAVLDESEFGRETFRSSRPPCMWWL
ncbi:hypothetical protein JCM10908_001048 [Rhodotorula pacifica]|uniref:argonaute/piwi family protein n=1 Tax=Rhodotorula pacifica TaxID=1495444 RepID=UPI00317A716B